MGNTESIEACVKALAYMAKSAYVADELRGAVWEFFLENPTEQCTPKNTRLRRFIIKTLQLGAAFSEMSDIQVNSEGEEYSIADIVTPEEHTPETLLAEAQDPTPEPDEAQTKAAATQRVLTARVALTWREEVVFRMRADGIHCAKIATYLGVQLRHVHRIMAAVRDRIENPMPAIPAVASIPTPRLRLAPLCLRPA